MNLKIDSLNAADYFTLAMDHEIRKSGLPGNICAIVVELEMCPDVQILSAKVKKFVKHFPLTVARLKKTGLLYAWELRSHMPTVFYHHRNEKNNNHVAFQQQTLSQIMNKRQALENVVPVEFHLLESDDRASLVLRWLHPLCDAKGAELILYYMINELLIDSESTLGEVDAWLAQHSIWNKIKLGVKAKNNMKKLARVRSTLLANSEHGVDTLDFHIIHYDKKQTKTIFEMAYKSCGMMGTALYFIGCMMRVLSASDYEYLGDGLCAPYAFNLRKRKALTPIFGNQVSFLFAQARYAEISSRQSLFLHLLAQNKHNIRAGLDYAMLPLMQLGRWLPLKKYGRIVRDSPQGTERSSFWFSYTGEMEPPITDILGCKVKNIFQLSPVTVPPAFCFLVNLYDGALTTTYCYSQRHFNMQKIDQIATRMTMEMMDESNSI